MKNKEIKIEYNGSYPNLCSGELKVTIDGKEWDFGFCLDSGGSALTDNDQNEIVEKAPWIIDKWPKDFPENLKNDVLRTVNGKIPYGCCGGCV